MLHFPYFGIVVYYVCKAPVSGKERMGNMKKIRIGVVGVGRGNSMMDYCAQSDNAELVAICDNWAEGLAAQKEKHKDETITFYSDYEEFLQHDMDAVVLANFANEHAPFAIRAMRAGKHVFSEVLPVQTMKEAVELVEAVEETGMIYAYGENYCYMPAPYEMRRLYREGKLGELEYAEGEYIHNCEPNWACLTRGKETHWRNTMYSTFYCTHSFGPIRHITGLRPVSVIGFEGTQTARNLRVGSKSGQFGIEMVTLENGAIVKSIHGGLYRNSIWYTLYGAKGRAESAREDTGLGDVSRIYVYADEFDGQYADIHAESYEPEQTKLEAAHAFGHGGSDYFTMNHFVRRLLGDETADIIDVYEALDMFLPGLFAYRSILAGGKPMAIPDLRNKAVRDAYRSDTACTDPDAAGEQLLPTSVRGTPKIEADVYARMKRIWDER